MTGYPAADTKADDTGDSATYGATDGALHGPGAPGAPGAAGPDMAPTVAPRARLDFFHEAGIDLPRAVTPREAWMLMTGGGNGVLRLAFRIRDAVSARFGVRRIGGFSGQPPGVLRAGDRLDFFLVEAASPEMLVLTERDRHLDVMTCIGCTGRRVTVTASVVTHNRFGRAYMLPVAPAHRLIVHVMLRRLRRGVVRGGPAA